MSLPLLVFPKIASRADSALLGGEWVASEKIHGAQFVVGIDATCVRFGKRKTWLEPDEAFFGWQLLRSVLANGAHSIYDALGSNRSVWIYGELFGACYPHAEVQQVPGLVPVQTGIWYAPDLRYAVFDIVHGHDEGDAVFLAHDVVRELATLGGLDAVPVLRQGRLSELDQLPVRFASRVPGMLGLPPLPGNLAEGYVLKPSERTPVSQRQAIKKKIAEFDEARFDESSAFDNERYLDLESLLPLAARLINPARLASARSKVGTDADQIVKEAVIDALIDLRDIFPRRVESLSPDEEAALVEHMTVEARTEIAGN